MQTSGAILGIYMIVYIYGAEMFWKIAERSSHRVSEDLSELIEKSAEEKIRPLRKAGYFVLAFGAFTILLNMFWLYDIMYSDNYLVILPLIVEILFIFLVTSIGVFSLIILGRVRYFEEGVVEVEKIDRGEITPKRSKR
jgi:hypothetical protein